VLGGKSTIRKTDPSALYKPPEKIGFFAPSSFPSLLAGVVFVLQTTFI